MLPIGECNNERARKSLCRPKVQPKEFGAQPTSRSSGSHNLPISLVVFQTLSTAKICESALS